jgi:TRAP-type C4-dicarboxylate transport system substrate-binding protein
MKKTLSLVLVLMLILALFAGCSGGGKEEATEEPTATEEPAATEQPASQEPSGYDFSNDETFNLAFTLYLPDGNSAFDWITPLCEGVSEATDGTVNIEVFPGGTLAAGDETADAIKNGVADIGLWATGYGLGSFPFSYMIEYPGLDYTCATSSSEAFNRWLAELQPAESAPYKLLFAYTAGSGVYITTDPVRDLDDFAGKQIRTNAVNAPSLEAYGGTPVTLAVGEVYEALRTGVIDGYCGITVSTIEFKMQEIAKYATMYPILNSAFMVLMNQDAWDSLSEGQQAAVDAVAQDVYKNIACCYLERDFAAPAIETLKAAGVEIIDLPQEDLDEMLSLSQAILDEYAAGVEGGPEALTRLKEILVETNEEYPENLPKK